MTRPQGHETHEEPSRVHQLKKAIYELKQSSRAWFDKFSTIVAQYGLKTCVLDHSRFVQHSSTGSIVLIVYMNDIVISGMISHGITALKHYLGTYFHMKGLAHIHYFLGTEVARSPQGLSLSQRKYR